MFVQKAKQNYLKKRVVSSIEGPIFFTAPHSKKLVRGGAQYDEKKRIHLRQLYTSYLPCKMALETGSDSFCYWGKTANVDDKEIDPNYILPKMFGQNTFHQSLHHWALKNKGQPLLHIDVHGKFDRKDNREIDVGVLSMEVHWKGDPLCEEIKKYFIAELNPIFENVKLSGFQCKFNTSPSLHGYWGGEMCTMTEQAIMLGVPSLQLEIPRSVRKLLFKDEKLMKALCLGLKGLYKQVIVPYKSVRELLANQKIAEKFEPSIKSKAERQECLEQVALFEKKEELNLTVKYV